MNLLARTVVRGEETIDLQPREFRLLEFLMRNAGQVVTRTMLLEKVWDKALDKAQLKQMFFPEYEKAILTAVGNLSSWTFNADGARVHFSPYELAPYAAGSFECRLPLSLLRDVSRADQHLPK